MSATRNLPGTNPPSRLVFVQPRTAHTVHRVAGTADQLPVCPQGADPGFVIRYGETRVWAATPDGRALAWVDSHEASAIGALASTAASILARWYS